MKAFPLPILSAVALFRHGPPCHAQSPAHLYAQRPCGLALPLW
jgi:hypothetical protein